MRILVDLNLSPRWVDALHAAGFDAAHWSTLGPLDAPDTAIMAYAEAGAWIVLTLDLDFGAILAATQGTGPSVVQIRADDVRPEAIGGHVIGAIRQMTAVLEQGALIAVEPSRTRVRFLPLRR
jgi:predicted nuclease of predicted toxin-antitoxin system